MKLLINEKMGSYEVENKKASYKTLVERFIGDIVLCNNIIDIDTSVYDNMCLDIEPKYYDEDDNEITEEEYLENMNAYCDENIPDIYQYYLCNLSEWEEEQAKKAGLILSYSDILDCDVLCVDHFGTSWDYVLTNVELTDDVKEVLNNE